MYTPEAIIEKKGSYEGWAIEKVTSFYPKSSKAFGKHVNNMFSKSVLWNAIPNGMSNQEWLHELRTNRVLSAAVRRYMNPRICETLKGLKAAINKVNEILTK